LLQIERKSLDVEVGVGTGTGRRRLPTSIPTTAFWLPCRIRPQPVRDLPIVLHNGGASLTKDDPWHHSLIHVMLPSRGSKFLSYSSGISCLALLAAFLSCGIDLLKDHERGIPAPGSHSEICSASPRSHMVRPDPYQAPVPCNICYFHKLIGQSLFPAKSAFATTQVLFRSTRYICATPDHGSFDPLVSRGPPSSDSPAYIF